MNRVDTNIPNDETSIAATSSSISQFSKPFYSSRRCAISNDNQFVRKKDSSLNMDEAKEGAYRVIIGVCGTLSLMSILCLCLVIPSFYNYVDTLGAFSRHDFAYCEGTTLGIETEITKANKDLEGDNRKNRTRRNQYAGYNPTLLHPNAPLFQECPACCIPGERGPAGDPGLPGSHGTPGPDGSLGRPGTTPNASCIPERVFEPPPCLPCPQGPRGVPGHPGFPGDPGDPGILGRPGLDGLPGKIGDDGPPGIDGPPGALGPIGDKGITPEAHVIPGPPGDAGEPGPWGPPGHSGQPGGDGYPGSPGEKGFPGSAGSQGQIGYPGPTGPPGEAGPSGTPGTCICQDTEVVVQDMHGQMPSPKPSRSPSTQEAASGYGNEGSSPAIQSGYYQQ